MLGPGLGASDTGRAHGNGEGQENRRFMAVCSVVRRRQWHPTPVLLPGKSHGRRSLVGCSPWGREESNTTEGLHFHFSLSCVGEGNGNPLQCSCLENPRDGGAWWAAVYGVAQSRTRLKRLSSSSSSSVVLWQPRRDHCPGCLWGMQGSLGGETEDECVCVGSAISLGMVTF